MDREGIEEEYKIRGGLSDRDLIAEARTNPDSVSKGTIHSNLIEYCTQEEIDAMPRMLIARFSAKAYMAKLNSEEMKGVDLLKSYYPLLFKKLKAFADQHDMSVAELLDRIDQGDYDISEHIFPVNVD